MVLQTDCIDEEGSRQVANVAQQLPHTRTPKCGTPGSMQCEHDGPFSRLFPLPFQLRAQASGVSCVGWRANECRGDRTGSQEQVASTIASTVAIQHSTIDSNSSELILARNMHRRPERRPESAHSCGAHPPGDAPSTGPQVPGSCGNPAAPAVPPTETAVVDTYELCGQKCIPYRESQFPFTTYTHTHRALAESHTECALRDSCRVVSTP